MSRFEISSDVKDVKMCMWWASNNVIV